MVGFCAFWWYCLSFRCLMTLHVRHVLKLIYVYTCSVLVSYSVMSSLEWPNKNQFIAINGQLVILLHCPGFTPFAISDILLVCLGGQIFFIPRGTFTHVPPSPYAPVHNTVAYTLSVSWLHKYINFPDGSSHLIKQVALLWQRDRATRLSVEILQLQNIPFEN